MKIVFFGNSSKSLIGAKIIHQKLGISLIVTVPDKHASRRKIVESPLKVFAKQKKIETLLTNKLNTESIKSIKSLKPDFLVVEDYGLILPEALLQTPKYAPLNVHHSLLPKYRGPAPAPFTILAGDAISGVSIIHMNDRVDAGDIYAQEQYTLTPDETTDSLLTKLNELGGELVVKVMHDIVENKKVAYQQNESNHTVTHYMQKSDGYIDIANPPSKAMIDRMIRAYSPWPGVWTNVTIKNKEMRVKLFPQNKIQMEGKRIVSVKEFMNGYPELREVIMKLL